MKLYECIDKYIGEFGIKKVFGVPGSLIMPIWQNIHSAELILCSHEQEASYLATGYSKNSREPVMVLTTGGPGVTNCVSGIAAANIDSLPLIYISGRTLSKPRNHGLRQEEGSFDRCYDSNMIMRSVTKQSTCITDSKCAARDIYKAFQCAVSGRKGSVHISIPVDIQQAEIVENTEKEYGEIQPVMKNVKGYLQESKHWVKGCKRRLLVIGWGCWLADASDDVYQLAEQIGAPVICTVKAYCCMKNNAFLVGKLGYGYNKILSDFIKSFNPQEIFVFGSSVSSKDFSDEFLSDIGDAEIHVFSIGGYVSECGVSNVFQHCISSPKDLITVEEKKPFTEIERIKKEILACKHAQMEYYYLFFGEQKMVTLCKGISDLILKEKVTVTADAGNHLLDVAAGIWPKFQNNLFLDDGIRAMGSGICETVGMAFADSERRYVSVTGDGCMLMNGNVMYVAKKYHLPVIFLVINNSSLGRVRVGQMISKQFIMSDLGEIDFVSYASAFKVKADRTADVEECIRLILQHLDEQEPSLIELQMSKDEIPVILRARGVWN